jgi:Tol biopolymer transport system component
MGPLSRVEGFASRVNGCSVRLVQGKHLGGAVSSEVRSEVRHTTERRSRPPLAWTALTVAAVIALAAPSTGVAAGPRTERVSVSSTGAPGAGNSSGSSTPAISANGRYVAFDSLALGLVPGDTARENDVFVRDRKLDATERVSVSSSGRQGNVHSFTPSISADGRYVAFESRASNLVPGDRGSTLDIFVRDRKLDTTRMVSVTSSGDRGNGASYAPAISADGRYVAFSSRAQLVPGDRDGKTPDVFVRDRKRHTTRRVSVASSGHGGGGEFPVISANGRYVAFVSEGNLVPGDSGPHRDVYVRDRKLHTTRVVSVSSTGHRANDESFPSSISADGRYIAFSSSATNLVPGDTNHAVDAFVRDRKLHTTSRVSVSSSGHQGNFLSTSPAISANGRYVAFDSLANNLVPGDTNGVDDVFVRDRQLHTTRRVSVATAGNQANKGSQQAAISADGRFVAFVSDATNLVPGDTNPWIDVFVRGPLF